MAPAPPSLKGQSLVLVLVLGEYLKGLAPDPIISQSPEAASFPAQLQLDSNPGYLIGELDWTCFASHQLKRIYGDRR